MHQSDNPGARQHRLRCEPLAVRTSMGGPYRCCERVPAPPRCVAIFLGEDRRVLASEFLGSVHPECADTHCRSLRRSGDSRLQSRPGVCISGLSPWKAKASMSLSSRTTYQVQSLSRRQECAATYVREAVACAIVRGILTRASLPVCTERPGR